MPDLRWLIIGIFCRRYIGGKKEAKILLWQTNIYAEQDISERCFRVICVSVCIIDNTCLKLSKRRVEILRWMASFNYIGICKNYVKCKNRGLVITHTLVSDPIAAVAALHPLTSQSSLRQLQLSVLKLLSAYADLV